MEKYELYHHGVKGQRWGIRRFQNKDGSLTAAGRKRRSSGDGESIGSKIKTALATHAANKKAAAEAKEKADIEEKRASVLKSRSAKELYDNADLFTTKELQDAYNRLNLERNIKNLEPEPINQGEQFMKDMTRKGELVSNVVSTGTKLYNGIASIYNALTESGRENPLPLIKNDGDGKKKKDKSNNDSDGDSRQQSQQEKARAEQNARREARQAERKAERAARREEARAERETRRAERQAAAEERRAAAEERRERRESIRNARNNLFDADESVAKILNSASGKRNTSAGRDYVENLLLLEEPK